MSHTSNLAHWARVLRENPSRASALIDRAIIAANPNWCNPANPHAVALALLSGERAPEQLSARLAA